VRAVAGFGLPTLRDRTAVPDDLFVHFAGLFARRPPTAAGLECVQFNLESAGLIPMPEEVPVDRQLGCAAVLQSLERQCPTRCEQRHEHAAHRWQQQPGRKRGERKATLPQH